MISLLILEGNEPAISERKRPWLDGSRYPVSWWDVEQFSARGFFNAGCLLEGLKTECWMGSNMAPDVAIFNPAARLDERIMERAKDYLGRIESECKSIGLRISADIAKKATENLDSTHRDVLNYQWLRDQVDNLRQLINSEMKETAFFYITAEKGKYWTKYDQRCLFGDEVAEAFSSALFDIHGAGMCLAIGLGTPAVFHSMRILERGLGALGAAFSVSLAHTNWEPAIREIESKIREMHKDPVWKARADYKTMQEDYSQAASHFAVVKDAWRNYTMHARGQHGEDEAEIIFLNVQGLMQKLAALGLKEIV